MSNADLSDFYGRIARIEKARALGYGFEAEGTLGRSYYRKPRKRNRSIVAPVLFSLMCVIGMKGALHHQIGDAIYDARVERLMQGDGFERLGGYLMQADPATLFVSQKLSTL